MGYKLRQGARLAASQTHRDRPLIEANGWIVGNNLR